MSGVFGRDEFGKVYTEEMYIVYADHNGRNEPVFITDMQDEAENFCDEYNQELGEEIYSFRKVNKQKRNLDFFDSIKYAFDYCGKIVQNIANPING